ncbi:MAG: hypothetical protein GY784_12580 [Gammaproteobacteria bacterium]|nr:hypothetical protein [Gammaproteobacteria bacterium]
MHGGRYSFARDNVQGPFNLVANQDVDVASMVHVIGEIHPLSALEDILDVDVSSCLYLNENDKSGEIEVRSIHKGMGTSIYAKQECPLIMWNPNYETHKCFDVIDIQDVFNDARLKNSFVAVISESLRELELFPPLMHLKK